MAKFQRLGPVWRKPSRNSWQKQKNLTRWANERQAWTEEQQRDPAFSLATEIAMEGPILYVLATEQSNISTYETTTFIVTEGSL